MASVVKTGKVVAHGDGFQPLVGITQVLPLVADPVLQVVDIAAHVNEPEQNQRQNEPVANQEGKNRLLRRFTPFVGLQNREAEQREAGHGH